MPPGHEQGGMRFLRQQAAVPFVDTLIVTPDASGIARCHRVDLALVVCQQRLGDAEGRQPVEDIGLGQSVGVELLRLRLRRLERKRDATR